MKKYTVLATMSIDLIFKDLEAKDYDDAREKAACLDGGLFTEQEGSGDWNVYEVMEQDDE